MRKIGLLGLKKIHKPTQIVKFTMEKPYFILAYYYFTKIENPKEEVLTHKAFLESKDVKARIYISEQGINGQFSGARADAEAYMAWMKSRELFSNIVFKIDEYHEHVFPRLTIKYRKQLVAIDKEVNMENQGEHLSPEKWKEMLDRKEAVLLDVRNDYEWEVGHFEGAELPPCETFREFNQFADDLKEKIKDAKRPVMMYCTGGIRCEVYSSLLKEKGIEPIFQLEGGVINYGKKMGNEHWKGKLFVFDDRLTVPLSEEGEAPVIGKCHLCGTPCDHYYNCANMDCNKLYICCQSCLHEKKGCCKDECASAPRVRPYHQQDPHKPFRKAHNYFEPTKNKN